jgi:hypothetical protein
VTAPLTFLGQAIDLIGRNASVLPTVGGAFKDLAQLELLLGQDMTAGFAAPIELSTDARATGKPSATLCPTNSHLTK